MAGKQYSKHKTIAIYDYFLRKVSGDERNGSVTVEYLRQYLKDLFGDDFERKSVYSDIAAINDYKRLMNGQTKDWIELRGKNSYIRNVGPGEFTMDEVHLLLDAVNATPIVDEKIAEKIKKQWPSYFDNDEYVSFIACERQKPTRAFVSLMNSIRRAIKEKTALKIKYGYKLTEKDPANCIEKDRTISPLALYWEENKYYLFAVDNVRYAEAFDGANEASALRSSLRQFRIDRIGTKVEVLGKSDFIDCDLKYVKEKISGSVDAYSDGNSVNLSMNVEGEPELVLRVFNYLRSEITVKGMINDNWAKGKLTFFIEVSPSARFFALLTNLTSFSENGEPSSEGIRITIEGDSSFSKAYEAFLDRARNNVCFKDRD